MIYKHALVRGVIRIVSTAHPFEKMPPQRNNGVEIYYPEPNPNKSEILRSSNKRFENVKDIEGSVGDEVTYSYGILPGQPLPLVNIFLTSRMVYSETWPIFYQKNAFSFALPSNMEITAVNCIRFLWDRPYHALRYIRELHLLVGHACHLPFRHILIGSDSWETLLDEINKYLSVRILVLHIRGRTDDALEHRHSEMPWREWLCKMDKLQELHIDIATRSTHEQNIALVQHLRSNMVVGGEQLGTEGFTLARGKIKNLGATSDEVLHLLSTSSYIPNLEDSFCFNTNRSYTTDFY